LSGDYSFSIGYAATGASYSTLRDTAITSPKLPKPNTMPGMAAPRMNAGPEIRQPRPIGCHFRCGAGELGSQSVTAQVEAGQIEVTGKGRCL